jgi:hypothetical protein
LTGGAASFKNMLFACRYDENFAVNWINIARDPIDRLVSDFYYNREEERWKDVTNKPSLEWFSKDLSQCILENDIECDFSNDYLIEQQLTYFCGSAPECRQVGNYKALQVAKYNAEMHYSVIGITEHLRISLAILEKYLPRFVFLNFDKLMSGALLCSALSDRSQAGSDWRSGARIFS